MASLSEREEAAYAVLEESRIVCERLLRARAASQRRGLLETLHRELGMAGFCASANLESQRRRAALELAHRRCRGKTEHGGRAEDQLTALTEQAQVEVERALIAPGLSDHMHTAHVHIADAREILPLALSMNQSRAAGERRQPSAAH